MQNQQFQMDEGFIIIRLNEDVPAVVWLEITFLLMYVTHISQTLPV